MARSPNLGETNVRNSRVLDASAVGRTIAAFSVRCTIEVLTTAESLLTRPFQLE
jgi:hypothetical protein